MPLSSHQFSDLLLFNRHSTTIIINDRFQSVIYFLMNLFELSALLRIEVAQCVLIVSSRLEEAIFLYLISGRGDMIDCHSTLVVRIML